MIFKSALQIANQKKRRRKVLVLPVTIQPTASESGYEANLATHKLTVTFSLLPRQL
jgi:hypothetical protein